MVKIVCKIINLFLPNLACFAPWRESIPASEYFRLPENLRELRKFSTIVIQSSQRTSACKFCVAFRHGCIVSFSSENFDSGALGLMIVIHHTELISSARPIPAARHVAVLK